MRSLVRAHHVQERRLAAQQLAPDQLQHQAPRVTPALVLGVGADAADLVQSRRGHALAGHGDQHAGIVEVAEVLAQFDRARAEGAGLGQQGQRQGLPGMACVERDRVQRFVLLRHDAAPDHAVHRRFGLDAPAHRRRAGPCVAVEAFARRDEGQQGREVGLLRIRKADDGREAGCVAARGVGAGREVRVRSAQRVPENVVEKGSHSMNTYAFYACLISNSSLRNMA